MAEQDGPLSGRVVGGRWRVLGLLGRGGMGSVYEAQNTSIGKRVALKFVDCKPDDADAILRFQREAEAASSVESAHIVQVFDTGTTDEGQPYLVMELLRGEPLGARIKRQKRLSVAEATHVLGQALRGLMRAHEAGIIHRDLKPDNVFLVDRDDDPLFVKILDFGVSKIARPDRGVGPGTLTGKGVVLGTPFYMSPEQAQAAPDLDARSDLFAAGVILFECLAGHAPWASLSSYEAVVVAICSRDTPDVRVFAPEVPAPLARVVARALERDRGRRFASALEFFEALREASPGLLSTPRFAGAGPSSGPSGSPPTSTTWTPAEPRPAAPRPAAPRVLLGVAAAALAFGGTLLLLRPPPAPARPAAPPPASPALEVEVRIEVTPPGAVVLVDGRPLEGGVLRGVALSEHEIRAEAPGYEPVVLRELLDGKPSLRIDLAPAASAQASSRPPSPPRPSARSPQAPSAPASAPPASSGLKLKGTMK